jgi:hypothetical protein
VSVGARAVTRTLVFFFAPTLQLALPIPNQNFIVINLLSRQIWFENPIISCTKNQSECESESGDTNSGFFLRSHAPTRTLIMLHWLELINFKAHANQSECESESGDTNSGFFLRF